MTIIRSTLPHNSLLSQTDIKYDYVDSSQGSFIDNGNKLNSTDVGRAFFSSAPKWVDRLMMFRNKSVAIFGLKTSGRRIDRKKALESLKCEKGERVGIFKIYDKTEKELILGEDDKHLNFRVSLFLEKSQVEQAGKILTISTTIIFNNWLGRLYFLPVRLFHNLIVSAMLKATMKELEKFSI